MLTSTFLQWRQIDVSATSESEAETKELRHITLVSDDGQFKIGQQSFSVQTEGSVQAIVEQDPNAIYVINVESGLHTQSMIDLLDAFKQAGAVVTLAGVN
jgi:biopolymer transport protein ExbD